MGRKVAVVLAGCGVYDGSEIQEAVLTLLALDQAGAEWACFAPDAEQADVVDHRTGRAAGGPRNAMAESARIARGPVGDIAGLRAADFDALVIPGGFGVAKNLCTYAAEGANATAGTEPARVLAEFHAARKPVCAMCIAPALVAAAFRGGAVKPSLTIGTDAATAGHIEAMGAAHVACQVGEIHVDRANLIVTTPAYMLGHGPAEVFTGIEKAVGATLGLCR